MSEEMAKDEAGGTIPTRTVVKYGAAAFAVLVVLWMLVGRGDGSPPVAGAAAPVVIRETPTTIATPSSVERLDPLAQLGVMSPTAAALVGPSWEARRELARRSAELMARSGLGQCSLVIGASGEAGSWELSTTHGPAFPVFAFAGCPWPQAAGR